MHNKSFLAKWIWGFGVEEESLWKRVVSAKYGVVKDSLKWNWNGGVKGSAFIKSIANLISCNSVANQFLRKGMVVVVGNGKRADFWSDLRIDDYSLKEAFSRIYSLAVLKAGCVRNFGVMDGHEWKWEVKLRRRLFNWETNQWRGLLGCLSNLKIMPNVNDSVVWKYESSGQFTVKSFRRCLENGNDGEVTVFKEVWLGFCPPKIEMFVWQLIHGRVLVKAVLDRFGVHIGAKSVCVLCEDKEENVDHLFLLCCWSWKLWQKCMDWWGISCCPSRTIIDWWKGWMSLCPWNRSNRAWRTLLFAVTWTIWEVRNHKEFKDEKPDLIRAMDMVKFRLAWWFKHFGKGFLIPITVMLENIVESCSEELKRKFQSLEKWSPPDGNRLFFNVDGSVVESPGSAGMGGVLRDNSGKVLCVFSSHLGVQDVILAELIAILHACILFGSKSEVAHRPLTIFSDSKTAVNWIMCASSDCNSHEHIIEDIRIRLKSFVQASVEFCSRSINSFVDVLAKKGLTEGVDDLWWSID